MKESVEFNSSSGPEIQKKQKKPLFGTFQELGALGIVWFYMGIHKLSPKAKHFFLSEMAPSIIRGERRKLSYDATVLLEDFRLIEESKTKIPNDHTPLLVVGNHWDKGPLHGRWPSYLISKTIADSGRDGKDNEVRWIMQDALEFLRTGKTMPSTEYILDKIITSYNLFKVTASFKREKNKNNHDTLDVIKRIAKAYADGTPIGLYPEACGTTVLQNGNWRSGFLISFLAKKHPHGLVLPVGQWNENKNLHLNFGDPFPIGQFANVRGEEGNKKVADLVMEKIAPLVPKNYRGVFGGR